MTDLCAERQYSAYVYLAFNAVIGLAIGTQLIHHCSDSEQSFLKVFQCLSGQCSPKTIGITDRKQVRTLITRMKTQLKFTGIQTKNVMILCFVLSFASFALKCRLKYCIIVGIPNSLLFSSVGYYVWTIILYKAIYFHIIFSYMKFRIKTLNDSTIEAIKCKQFYRIQEIICGFSSIYAQLNDYDTGVWPHFLFAVWLCLSQTLATGLLAVWEPLPLPWRQTLLSLPCYNGSK